LQPKRDNKKVEKIESQRREKDNMKKFAAAAMAAIFVLSISTAANAQHYVEKGETLSKIAKEYKMTLKDIISLNPHIENPNVIHPNDYIIVRTQTEKQKDLVDYARSLQSVTAYQYGGQEAPFVTDCSGWAQHVFKKFGVNIARVSRDQAKQGTPVKFQDLQIGDLMFFSVNKDKTITHVGIYMGNDYWISNLNEEKDVEILSTWGTWAQKYFLWGTRHKL
jgi:cell wall-associated NlpC family hydrolase